jgi:hypothetical protein
MANMQSDFVLGQADRGLFCWQNNSRESWLPKQEKEDEDLHNKPIGVI